MKFFIAIVVFCMFSVANAKSFSIMHPEYNYPKEPTQKLTLNGVVYISDNQWVIWLNQKRITPKTIPSWIKIHKVTETYIEGEYKVQNVWHKITLEAFDTFCPPPSSDSSANKS